MSVSPRGLSDSPPKLLNPLGETLVDRSLWAGPKNEADRRFEESLLHFWKGASFARVSSVFGQSRLKLAFRRGETLVFILLPAAF